MFVLDCSVTLAWCFEDEANDYADQVLDIMENQNALVPSLWHLEVLNVLLVGERRKRITANVTTEFLDLLSELHIQTDTFSNNINDNNILLLSRQYQLSSYDAAYLALAQREQLPLATIDKKLQVAAKHANLFFHL